MTPMTRDTRIALLLRSDKTPSSLCFGRSLMNAERDAAGTKRELADFKQALPDSKANDAYW